MFSPPNSFTMLLFGFKSLHFYKNFNLLERSLSDTSEVEGLLTVKLF